MLLGAVEGVIHFLVLLPDADDAGDSDGPVRAEPVPWADLRTLADMIELHVESSLWPMPTYREMLFLK